MVAPDSLQELVGLRLTKAQLAVDQMVVHFGPLREVILTSGRYKGDATVAGAHGLYLKCPWRLLSRGTVLTGSNDVYVYAGDHKPPRWTFRDGDSLLEMRMDEVVRRQPVVRATHVDLVAGDIVITFDGDDDLVLEAYGASSSGEEWMFFEPHSDRESLVFRERS